MPEYYSAHRKMNNVGKEPAAAKRLSTLPAVIRQPLPLNKNIISRGTNFPAPGQYFTATAPIYQSTAKPRSNLRLKTSSEGLVNPGLHSWLQFCLRSIKQGGNPAKDFSSLCRWFIFLCRAAQRPPSPNCRLLSCGCSEKCSQSLLQSDQTFFKTN